MNKATRNVIPAQEIHKVGVDIRHCGKILLLAFEELDQRFDLFMTALVVSFVVVVVVKNERL